MKTEAVEYKYNVGDKVWFLVDDFAINNKCDKCGYSNFEYTCVVKSDVIEDISIQIDITKGENITRCSYILVSSGNIKNEKELFKTEEEAQLRANIKNNKELV